MWHSLPREGTPMSRGRPADTIWHVRVSATVRLTSRGETLRSVSRARPELFLLALGLLNVDEPGRSRPGRREGLWLTGHQRGTHGRRPPTRVAARSAGATRGGTS